jgi:TRAP-type C4-dicarboxylate transport system substrate-binding protein
MKKTTRILTATAALTAVALMAGVGATPDAYAQEVKGPKVKWRLSLWGKRRAFTEGLEYISSEVKRRTGGNFQIRLYYGGQLSKNKENLDGISVGAFEAALFCAAYHPQKNKPLNVLDLPFLPLANFDVMREVHDAVYNHPASKKALARWNAVLYMSNILPQYEYMGRGKPPKTVADFKGMRLRALGGMGRAAKAIGAVPTTVPAPEVYNSIARGTVDAVGFPFTYAFGAYKVDEVAEWYTTNMSLGTVNCPVVFNKDAWNKLPKQYKDLFNELKLPASKAQQAAYAKKDKENLAKWPKKMTPIKIDEKSLEEFRRIGGKPLWKQWVKENEGEIPAQELLDLVLKTAAEASKKYGK